MRLHALTKLGLLPAALLLAACETGPQEMMAEQISPATASDPCEMATGAFDECRIRTNFHRLPEDELFTDQANLERTLNAYGVPRNKATLKAWIARIANSKAMTGVGGGIAAHILDGASATLQGTGFGQGFDSVEVHGQIQQMSPDPAAYPALSDLPNPPEPGYSYTKGTTHLGGSGWLWVAMTYILRNSNSGAAKKFAELYKVQVDQGMFFEVRDTSHENPNDVFPAAGALTGIHITQAMAGPRNVKLYAHGENVRVANYYIARNFKADGTPMWMPANGPQYDSVTAPDPNSCIDMMFNIAQTPKEPPSVLLPTDKPPYYCLGRCPNPPIINTW